MRDEVNEKHEGRNDVEQWAALLISLSRTTHLHRAAELCHRSITFLSAGADLLVPIDVLLSVLFPLLGLDPRSFVGLCFGECFVGGTKGCESALSWMKPASRRLRL